MVYLLSIDRALLLIDLIHIVIIIIFDGCFLSLFRFYLLAEHTMSLKLRGFQKFVFIVSQYPVSPILFEQVSVCLWPLPVPLSSLTIIFPVCSICTHAHLPRSVQALMLGNGN